ncbi:hypothetical protein [Pseudovibrio sp. Tun.PSC04-5.I4]|uniref:hypothetical protein n=1 Tax=Pseudovibrio sp. Tun.PSC04-5.I4 TaxID=1798213 RepID=UPI0008805D3B|nr:hypothetical protein [Pseudovibrio sp. Tun.PSC04-5.I4]SDR49142.1 hypothetical protein SAMN04515695_6132 [Pseudovibrio sp. Tun.PSC04-5.I4]
MRQGDLFQYRYLWAYQAKRGEEAGRKSRPCCLVIKVRDQLALFPCTTQEPEGRGRIYLEIPDLERKRANLDTRSFIVLDEFNIVRDGQLYDFESLRPQGQFSEQFLRKIARVLKDARAEKRQIQNTHRT